MADTQSRNGAAVEPAALPKVPGGASLWVPLILLAYVAFWTYTRNITHYNLDRHGDMVENFAWGIGWQLGYQKHPPLFAWITALWFEVFPRTNVAYFLLSSVNVAVTTFVVWLVSRRFLSQWQQVIAVLLTFTLPLLGFQAMVYNANSAMLPFWALAALFYIRTLERGSIVDAALTGAFCGLAVLAKYHSAVLVGAIALHALLDRDARKLVLRSALPWAAALTGLAVLAPHLWWMVQNNFRTITYAAEQGDGTLLTSIESVVTFLVAFLLYSVPGLVIALLHWRPRNGVRVKMPEGWRRLAATVEGRALLWIMGGSIALTVALALGLSAQLSSLWAIPIFFAVPILIAAAIPASNAARYWHAAPVTTAIFCAVVIAIAPTLRAETLERAASNTAQPIAVLAQRVQETWREDTGTPLRIVAASEYFLSNGTAFYASDRPYSIQGTLDISPWVSEQDIQREGAVYLCRLPDPVSGCAEHAADLLGQVDKRVPVSIPALEGAGGPREWDYLLLLRYPSAQTASN